MALYVGFPDTLLVFVFAFTAQEHVMLADIFESYIHFINSDIMLKFDSYVNVSVSFFGFYATTISPNFQQLQQLSIFVQKIIEQ